MTNMREQLNKGNWHYGGFGRSGVLNVANIMLTPVYSEGLRSVLSI